MIKIEPKRRQQSLVEEIESKKRLPIRWDIGRKEKRDSDDHNFMHLKSLMARNERLGRITYILSLPADLWIWEMKLAAYFPNNIIVFVGVERDKDVHARSEIRRRQLDTGHGTNYKLILLEYGKTMKKALQGRFHCDHMILNGRGKQFDIIYADYMGCLAIPKMREVEILFRNQSILADGGIFMITLSLNLRNTQSELYQKSLRLGYPVMESEAYQIIDCNQAWRDMKGDSSPRVHAHMHGIRKLMLEAARNNGVQLTELPGVIYYSPNKYDKPTRPEACFVFKKINLTKLE